MDDTLRQILHRFSENNLTLNLRKCEFDKLQMEFFGFVFSQRGISPSENKVVSIKQLQPPTSATEVRSFLGMTNYLSRFIPLYSAKTAPLRTLTEKDVTWNWGHLEQQAFEELKQALTSDKVLTYFDPKRKTAIVTDAGPNGISAILLQNVNNMDKKVVAYSSRALTDAETRYSQLEKEALAILHGCEKFRVYLIGSTFEVYTDHLPLVTLLNKPNKKIPLRLERWALRLQAYNFTVKHIKGTLNPADYCSRNTQWDANSIASSTTEEYISFIVSEATPRAITIQELKSHRQTDPTLQELRQLITSNKWREIDKTIERYENSDVKELNIYNSHKHELTLTSDGNLILRGNRTLIPFTLRQRLVNIAHESHCGVSKTKSIMRDKVYFPGLDELVETTLRNCLPCKAVSRPDHPPPLKMSTLPPDPWHTVNMDFLGPLPDGSHLLVVIDQRSRFPEVEIVGTTSAHSTLGKLDRIFATHGLPNKVITDNGSPFHSHEFQDYMKHRGIDHHKITPLHPKANSTAENFMRGLNKTLRTAVIDGKQWKSALYDFLLSYRVAKHSTTQVSPAEVMFYRKLRTKIPSIDNKPDVKALRDLERRDQIMKENIKRYTDNRNNATYSSIKVGDYVLVKQQRRNKLSANFDPKPYRVMSIKGYMITAQRPNHRITRNSQHFKFLSSTKPQNFEEEEDISSDDDDYEEAPREVQNQIPAAERRQYPGRNRQRPSYFHEEPFH